MMIAVVGIGTVVMIVLFGVFCWNTLRLKTFESREMVLSNCALLIASLVLFRYCFPWAASMVLYQGILLHFGHALLVVVAAAIGYYAYVI